MRNISRLSGKVVKIPSREADPNRYEYLDLGNAEPDLGVPSMDNAIPSSTATGDRSWINIYPNFEVTPNGNLAIKGTDSLNVANTLVFDDSFEYTTSKNSADFPIETVVASFPISKYRGGKFIVLGRSSEHTHLTELLVVHNYTDAFYTEYGTIYTSSPLFTVSVDIVSSNVRIILTPSALFPTYDFNIMEQKLMVDTSLLVDSTTRTVDASSIATDETGTYVDSTMVTVDLAENTVDRDRI